jgi:ribokinase
VNFEVAVIGAPFLDLTFEGLERVPNEGEELVARGLHVAPGGTGMQAIAAARLGLSVALVAPVGGSGAAKLVTEVLTAERVTLVFDSSISRQDESFDIPVTALLTTPNGVAMASVLAGTEPSPAEVKSATAPAVLTSLGRLELVPPGASVYAVTGGLELDAVTPGTMRRLGAAHALILNAREASALTTLNDPTLAALELARTVPTAIVTVGATGALAAQGHDVITTSAPDLQAIDATGAGDLFAAAYVWAELRGAGLEERLAWATLYASLSTRTATALSGALHLEEFLSEGRTRGLATPAGLTAR